MSSLLPQGNPSSQDMLDLISGFWLSQAIYVAAKLGIADQLQDGPKSASVLAKQAEVHEPALYRVLRTLASRAIFFEDTERLFGLSPAAEWLRSDKPGSLRPYAIMMGEHWVWQSVGEMLHSVRTGESGFEQVFGSRTFDYYAEHPHAARFAVEGMTSRSTAENLAIVGAYDFSGISTIIDVAGGQGTLLSSILAANSNLSGTLFDMRHSELLAQIGASGLHYVERPVTIRYSAYSIAKGQKSSDSVVILLDLFARALYR